MDYYIMPDYKTGKMRLGGLEVTRAIGDYDEKKTGDGLSAAAECYKGL